MTSGKNGRRTKVATPCSCTALRKATRRVSLLYDAALARSGLKTTQRAILAEINRSGPITVGLLAEALVMDPGALAHTLKPLKRDGLVSIDLDPEDRRSRRIALTKRGYLRLTASDESWEKAQRSFDEALGRRKFASYADIMTILISDEFAAAFGDGASSGRKG
jgi:DNA-binding MarR family transcriptional regulator